MGIKQGKVVTHTYTPWGGCKELFNTREEEVLISGPAGTGKSRACLEKVYAVCLLTPNTRALILRKTLRSLGSTALVTWRNYVIKEALETGTVVYYGGSSQEAPQYRFKNGSTVTIGGLDNPTRIMSSEYDIVYVQEATEITIEDIEFIKTRLRNWRVGFQQLIMDCNPAGDKHPLKLRCNDKITKLIESRHEDNPVLFELCEKPTIANPGDEENPAVFYKGVWLRKTDKGKKYIGILDKLTGVRHKRLRLGLWVSAEGIVYEEFDPAIHVLPWFYTDEADESTRYISAGWEEWSRYWVIDFGYAHAFVLKCYAKDPENGAFYMYREIHMTQRTVAEHAKTILDIVAPEKVDTWYDHINRIERERRERVWVEPKPELIICDHDAEGRRTFEKATGLGTRNAIKNVYEGINLVKERLTHGKFYLMADALVERDQYLVDNLMPTCTEEEYPAYVWKVSSDGRRQDEPVKKDDDGVDCDRYLITFFDWRGVPRATQL